MQSKDALLRGIYMIFREIYSYLKGVWHEILSFKFFSWISFPTPQSIPLGPFQIFFQKFAKIFSNECLSAVNDISNKREKFWGVNFFHILYCYGLSWVHFTDFCLIFKFRCRPADIGSTVLLPVLVTPAKKFIRGVIDIGEQFSAVLLTLAINFRLLWQQRSVLSAKLRTT